MVPKVKKEAPFPPKAETNTKGFEGKKQTNKNIAATATEKRSARHPHSDEPRHCMSELNSNILERASLGETS